MKLLPAVVDPALERVRQSERLAETEEEFRRAHDESERHVEQRTAELAKANRRLRVEMDERRRAEDAPNSIWPNWPTSHGSAPSAK